MAIRPSAFLTFRIDDGPATTGELTIEQDSKIETTGLPKADERWSFVDAAGHWHGHSTDKLDTYPTLRAVSVHRECDGSCGGACRGEGYHVTKYTCRICAEEIQPGLIPGPHKFIVPGLKSWRATVHTFVRQDQVTVRIASPERVLFGVALRVETRSESSGYASTDLAGYGPLGTFGGAS